MLHMRTDRWYRHAARSMVMLTLVVMSGFFPVMAQVAQASGDSYRSSYGYDWDDDDDQCAARYYVHRGDTLSRIAARYGVSVYAIARVNGIHNIHRIYPGQYLCIPAHDWYHGWHHDWYDDDYRYYHDDDKGYGHKDYHEADDYGYYGHKRHDDDGYGKQGYDKHGYHEAAYGPVEKEYADPGYYRTSGGHTGVCYYPDPRYNAEEAEFYEDDERPDCS